MSKKENTEAVVALSDTAIAIEQQILFIRGRKVMLDSDLATLYGVTTKRLNEQVRRNTDRFPQDFAFQLTNQEVTSLRSQIATLKQLGPGQHRKYLPYVFTEQGVAMLSSVLRSPRAIVVNVEIMRAFVRLRAVIASNKAISRKLQELERKLGTHDQAINDLIVAIRQIMNPPVPKRRGIGFIVDD